MSARFLYVRLVVCILCNEVCSRPERSEGPPFVDSTAVGNGSEPVLLGPAEIVDDHPCTDTSLYAVDRGLLAYMLQDVRGLARRVTVGEIDAE